MSKQHDLTPAALYARVSSERQDVDLSVSAQLRALRDYADKNGYLVAREYIDEAESGRIADRPQFRKMLDEAARPESPFQEILVWKFSRFTRKREHAVAFKSMLRRKGIRVVSITEHADDSPTGKLMEAIIESVDEFYSENLAQEVSRGMREAASRKLAGNWSGSAERLYSGQSRLAEQGNAGKAFGPEGPLGSGPVYLDYVGKDTFYGLLAALRGQMFSDDDFAEIYCPDNGRDSVPPSLLATALLLQTYDQVSDAEAKARADFDIRWKVALGIEIEDRPFAKSTLQMFRAQLILHEKVREVFEGSLRLARQSGYLKKRGMRVALDTTYILGRGAVKDTYNLLADGIVKLLRVLAAVANATLPAWAEAQGYERYFGSSIKGEATIDWSDRKARAALLVELVADADRLLELARQAWVELPEDSAQRQSIVDGAELLGQLLLQDVERKSGDGDGDAADDDDGVSIRDGVSKDRMLSVHDPELRHGHKSSRRRFNGHKAAIVVDTDSQLITAVDVLPGNAPDNLGALELVEQSEASTGSVVEEAMGDAAYGDGGTRETFADAGRRLVARVPGRPDRKHFPKNDFHLDLAAGSCTCPAGQVTRTIVPAGKRTDRTGRVYRLQAFQFDGAVCRVCPLRSQCIAAQGRQGRRVLIHPQEGMLQQARALQQSADYDEYRARRVVVEHRLARLVQLGIRQSRYFGRVKTKFQLYLAATVANLTLVLGKIGLSGSTDGGAAGHRVVLNVVHTVVANAAANFSAVRLGQLWSLILLVSALLPQLHFQIRAFRPGF